MTISFKDVTDLYKIANTDRIISPIITNWRSIKMQGFYIASVYFNPIKSVKTPLFAKFCQLARPMLIFNQRKMMRVCRGIKRKCFQ